MGLTLRLTGCGDWQLPQGMVLCCGLMPDFGCVGSVAPWEGLPCRPSPGAAFDCLWLSGRSYKAIRRWLLPTLNLEASGRNHSVSRGQLPPVLGLGWLSKWTSASQGLGLPASCLYNSTALKVFEWYVNWGGGRDLGSHWGEANKFHPANAESGFMPVLNLCLSIKVSDHSKENRCPL